MTPTTPALDREAVARIIEPDVWRAYDATLRPFVENRGAHEGESWHVRAYQDGCRSVDDARAWWFGGCKSVQPVTMFLFLQSIEKAAAILALTQASAAKVPEGAAENDLRKAARMTLAFLMNIRMNPGELNEGRKQMLLRAEQALHAALAATPSETTNDQ